MSNNTTLEEEVAQCEDFDYRKATVREVFERCQSFLLEQGIRSQRTDSYGRSYCAYRSGKGFTFKCGAGCLFPDGVYQGAMEHKTWEDIVGHEEGDHYLFPPRPTEFGLSDRHWELIAALQDIHDAGEPSEWLKLFKSFEMNLGYYEIVDIVWVARNSHDWKWHATGAGMGWICERCDTHYRFTTDENHPPKFGCQTK